MNIYTNIDMIKTGKRIESAIKEAGFDVKTIQGYLHLSCPQPIYRWFKGKVLPSIDHLYVLSGLLGVHMEELLVPKRHNRQITLVQSQNIAFVVEVQHSNAEHRLLAYCRGIWEMAA